MGESIYASWDDEHSNGVTIEEVCQIVLRGSKKKATKTQIMYEISSLYYISDSQRAEITEDGRVVTVSPAGGWYWQGAGDLFAVDPVLAREYVNLSRALKQEEQRASEARRVAFDQACRKIIEKKNNMITMQDIFGDRQLMDQVEKNPEYIKADDEWNKACAASWRNPRLKQLEKQMRQSDYNAFLERLKRLDPSANWHISMYSFGNDGGDNAPESLEYANVFASLPHFTINHH
jgi:hypothetical protein